MERNEVQFVLYSWGRQTRVTKLTMETARLPITGSDGGAVNFDAHGDGSGLGRFPNEKGPVV